jgi:hypothetical protein
MAVSAQRPLYLPVVRLTRPARRAKVPEGSKIFERRLFERQK